MATPAAACDIARYADPAGGAAAGEPRLWRTLTVALPTARIGGGPATPFTRSVTLPEGQAFRDFQPRCADVDGRAGREIIVVESTAGAGARMAVYGAVTGPDGAPTLGLIAATPPLGEKGRWRAPAGVGDFDGDGRAEIAEIEAPERSGVLRFWRLEGNALVEVASRGGFSNHRAGDAFLTGEVRDCAGETELLTPNLDWSALFAARIVGAKVEARLVAQSVDDKEMQRARNCRR